MKLNNTYKVIGKKPKYADGGATYQQYIDADDIRNREVNAVPNTALSTIGGAGAGFLGAVGTAAALGSTLGPIGTIIGAGGGALVGLIGGLFNSGKRKKQLAAARETERQQTIQTMNNKLNQDLINLREDSNAQSENQGYYARYGGRYKMAQGGLIPNSSDTQVAYGATHNQINNNTGETGVAYGNIEVEGGGDTGNSLKAGEVVQDVNNASQIFSNRLKLPGSKYTFARGAQEISNKKGSYERQAAKLSNDINTQLDDLTKHPMGIAKRNTLERNIEQSANKLNKLAGKIEESNMAMNELFAIQEDVAKVQGHRDNIDNQLAYGGKRKKYKDGGLDTMGLSFFLNSGLNLVNSLSTADAIDFESKLPVPKESIETARQFSTRYSISPTLTAIDRAQRNAEKYINSNTNNAQIARAAIGKVSIDAAQQKGQAYNIQNAEQAKMYDRNIQAQYETNNYNNGVAYRNMIAEYNKQVGTNQAKAANRTQFLQGMANAVGDYNDLLLQKYYIDATNATQVSQADINRNQATLNDTFGWNPLKGLFKRKPKKVKNQ